MKPKEIVGLKWHQVANVPKGFVRLRISWDVSKDGAIWIEQGYAVTGGVEIPQESNLKLEAQIEDAQNG